MDAYVLSITEEKNNNAINKNHENSTGHSAYSLSFNAFAENTGEPVFITRQNEDGVNEGCRVEGTVPELEEWNRYSGVHNATGHNIWENETKQENSDCNL